MQALDLKAKIYGFRPLLIWSCELIIISLWKKNRVEMSPPNFATSQWCVFLLTLLFVLDIKGS